MNTVVHTSLGPVVPILRWVDAADATQAERAIDQALSGLPRHSSQSSASETFPAHDGETARMVYPNAWEAPQWSPSENRELERATWLIRDLDRRTGDLAGIVAAMVRHPDGLTGSTIAEETGYYSGADGVAPALGHIARVCKQVDRRPMWHHWDNPAGPGTYSMDPAVAELFADALDVALPGWRNPDHASGLRGAP